MAYRTQSNPSSTSSDGVPPELAVLGFRGAVPAPSDRPAQGFAGVDRFDDCRAF